MLLPSVCRLSLKVDWCVGYPGLKSEVMMSLVPNGTRIVSCRAIFDNVKTRYKPKKHGSSIFHLDHLWVNMPI